MHALVVIPFALMMALMSSMMPGPAKGMGLLLLVLPVLYGVASFFIVALLALAYNFLVRHVGGAAFVFSVSA